MVLDLLPEYDVIILGGGLAGLCLARQLASHPGIRVLVLEKLKHPVNEAAFKVGESCAEVGSWYFDKVLDLADHIHQDQYPKYGIRFFFNRPDHEHLGRGLEMGVIKRLPSLAYQLDRGRLENYLASELSAQGIQFLDDTRVRDIQLAEEDGPHQVSFRHHDQDYVLPTRWVVDASGRTGLLKRKLGLQQSSDHEIDSVWFRIGTNLDIDDWAPFDEQRGACEKRWLSTNHMMGPGYWLWVIPLASGHTSIGIVIDPKTHSFAKIKSFERALAWLEEHEPHCATQVRRHQDQLKDFMVLRNCSYACRQSFSDKRWALTGESGFFADPLFSPGSDFIAIGNTLIDAMIRRDLKGRPIAAQSVIYENLYRTFYDNTMLIYRNQYGLFGNGRLMAFKIFWDYAIYWIFLAFFFIQGRITQITLFSRLDQELEEFVRLNERMQAFFYAWNDRWSEPVEDIFIDQGDFDYIRRLNTGLDEELNEAEFLDKFRENMSDLFAFAREMVEGATADFPELAEYLPECKDTGETKLATLFAILR